MLNIFFFPLTFLSSSSPFALFTNLLDITAPPPRRAFSHFDLYYGYLTYRPVGWIPVVFILRYFLDSPIPKVQSPSSP